MPDNFREGDHYKTDDRTGRKVRASDTRKEWTGRIVDKDWWEPRQPQDFVRGMHDRQQVPDPRPDVQPAFTGPLTTTIAAAAVAGATTITVVSTTRFSAADYLLISLDNRDMFRAQVQSVLDTERLTLVRALPGAVSVGNIVVNQTVNSPAVL